MKPVIAILGGGFGGIRCALDLEKKIGDKAKIILIDRNGYHFFTPILYEIASAYPDEREDSYRMKLRKAVAISYGEIFFNKKIDLIQAEIAGVDFERNQIALDGGGHIDFNYLVLALGSQSTDFGIPGVIEYAYQFKTTDDAIALNKKLDSLFIDAVRETIPLPLKFLVIGAGFTGVELAAELVSCGQKLAARYGMNRRSFSVTLFEAAPHILPMVSDIERKKIQKRLTELGVIIMENSAIEKVETNSIKLKTGQTIYGSAVVWTAGVQANTLTRGFHNLNTNDRGKIIVDEFLHAKNYENIFALGDIIEFIDSNTQKPVPGQAYFAKAQGSLIAENINRDLNKRKLQIYNPKYPTWVAPVGGKFAVVHINDSMTLVGFFGWIVRNIIDLRYFLSILPFFRALDLFKKDLMLFSKND
jgi:NADH dehydrogenase